MPIRLKGLGCGAQGLGIRGWGLGSAGLVRDYNSTPSKGVRPRFRTLLGLIKLYMVFVSSLNPGGVPLGGYYCHPLLRVCGVYGLEVRVVASPSFLLPSCKDVQERQMRETGTCGFYRAVMWRIKYVGFYRELF